MEQIFKKGDKVFCVLGGWGTVIAINKGEYPVAVEFDRSHYTYSEDGRVNDHTPPTLSFTEYTLDGFSQDRPNEIPKPGDVVWVRDKQYDNWMITYFRRFSSYGPLKYGTSARNSDDIEQIYYYRYLTTKNPYANEQ